MSAPTARLDFANQLRGFAALLVAVSHLIGVYWGLRSFVAMATFSPPQAGPPSVLFRLVSYKWFEFGPFGVAVFFLISGLVIPFSLRHHTRLTFLLARLLRIYPTFILAFALEMLVLYGASRYWRIPFTYTPRTMIFNCLLVSNLAGTPVIDFVSWTLSIEVKFYLLVTLIVPAIRRGRLTVIFGVAIFLMVMEVVLSRHVPPGGGGSSVITAVCGEAPYLVFMLIGVLFYFHHAELCTSWRFAATIPAMTLIFLATWRYGVLKTEFTIVAVNYLYALAIFTGLYILRRHIPEIQLFTGMASISYPFYLIHAALGFTVLKFATIVWHMSYIDALGVAVTAVTAVAFLLHVTVERWTIEFGKRISGYKFIESKL